ncbi:putative pectinesterase [Rosa chinensis]|uniref:Pectinesterase n=1 Tax=Rosa chinensis TaxID=74649 RepID=A0A2P6RL54_ROSCH|nr:pectinesterase [Rosa chinensis]PRQ47131.1 putative pectinesterase [Rosa chinensis]
MFQFVVLGFLWVLGGASVSGAALEKYQVHVKKECSFTRYPSICVQTLMGLGGSGQQDPQQVDIMLALVNKTIYETRLATSEFSQFSSKVSEVREAQPAHHSVKDYCEELMTMSLKRLDQSLIALKKSPLKKKQDIQAWLSAALTFQETCKDYAADHGLSLTSSENLRVDLSKRIDYASQLGSNLLALVNRVTSIGTPKNTIRDKQAEVFPKWVSPKNRKLLQATTVKANAVVAQDGSGNYKTVSEAIQAASGGRFVIYVKAGVYKEKIKTNKDGITLIGDGKYSTIITGDSSVAKGASMPGSATFTVTGDGFIARDIGFQNTAGPDGEQALALYISSDHSVLYKCSIVGYQDTLYALALRQFYRECDIHGSLDFIFGNAAAVFQSCNLILRRHKGYVAILASGRSDPGQKTGFSVQNCRILPGSDLSPVKHSYSSYLGRPWKAYARAVVMQSNIDDVIAPRGWVEWPEAGGSSLKSLYFAEFANMGPGAGVAQRVQWPGFHVIGADIAVEYTVGNFIGGTSWLPSTGVAFVSGLH